MDNFILGFIAGFVATTGWFYYKGRQLLRKIMAHMEAEASKPMIIDIRLEPTPDGSMFYAYNTADNTFVAQGKNLQEIVDVFSKIYPGRSLTINREHAKNLGLEMDL